MIFPFESMFHYFGMNLIPFKNHSEKISQIINLSFTLFNIFLITLLFQYPKEFFHQDIDLLGWTTDVVQTVFPILCHVVILLEANLKKNIHQNLDKKFMKIYKETGELFENEDIKVDHSAAKYFLFTNGICFMIEMCTYIVIKTRIWRHNLLIRSFAMVANRVNDFQFVYYVLKLNFVLEIINRKIKKVEKSHEKIEILKKIKIISNDIWETSDLLNTRFGFTIVWTVSSNFLAFIISLYWMFEHSYFEALRYKKFATAIVANLCIFLPVISCTILCFACSKCYFQVIILLIYIESNNLILFYFIYKVYLLKHNLHLLTTQKPERTVNQMVIT